MDSRYGDDNTPDTVLTLWNYSRAIHCFAKQMRDHKKIAGATKLLEHAISVNGYVPRFLLGHEPTKTESVGMPVGGEIEAGLYAEQHVKYWIATPGALQWLETVYLRLLGFKPGERDVDDITVEIRGGFHLHNQGKNAEALVLFKDLLPRIQTEHPLYIDASQCVAVIMMREKRYKDAAKLLRRVLEEYPNAKVCRYLKANGHETLHEWEAARREYQYVKWNIGAFSTADQGIARCTEMIRITGTNGRTAEAGHGGASGASGGGNGAEGAEGADIGDAAARDIAEAAARMHDRMQAMFGSDININPARGEANHGCTYCKKTGLKLRECEGCSNAHYCSKTCQKVHWKAHRIACKTSSGWKKDSKEASLAKKRKAKSKSKAKSKADQGNGSSGGGCGSGGSGGGVSNVKVGSWVTIEGLVSRAALNGTKGTVLRKSPNGERWIVKLAVDGTSLSLKPASLELV